MNPRSPASRGAIQITTGQGEYVPHSAFDEIWKHHPELQNRFSSSWWFFLLFPEQETGYGPRQMMFTYASRIGKMIGVKGSWQPGMNLRKTSPRDRFQTKVAGWIYDGDVMHKNVVFTSAMANLDYNNKRNDAWRVKNGRKLGGSLKASDKYEIGVDCHYIGHEVDAKFTAYALDYGNEVEIPQIVEVYGPGSGVLGNIHTVAWRRFRFDGEFSHQGRSWRDRGVGYFQRVLMNIPLHPWMWNYTVFQDGSVFSSFSLYSSLNYFRRSFRPLSKFLARRRFHIVPSAYFFDNSTKKTHYLDWSRITPRFGSSREVKGFWVKAKDSSTDDHILFELNVRTSTGYNMQRKIFRNFFSTYSWTEFMVETVRVKGSMGKRQLSTSSLGTGYGNTEYSMGISI